MDWVLLCRWFIVGMLIAFVWDDEWFACSKTMEISNLSLSLSHEYHHPNSLELTNGKDGTKQHVREY
jgi:hypothetical protein